MTRKTQTKRPSKTMGKRLFVSAAVLLAVCLVFVMPAAADVSVWDGTSVSSSLLGKGTINNPYLIQSAADLAFMRNQINDGAAGYSTACYAVTTDINLNGKTWTPIGTSNYDKVPTAANVKMFAGNFDGQNHIITGLTSDGYVPDSSETESTEYSFGLFGYVYGANISNVKFANVDIDCGTRQNSAGTNVAGSGVAALVGYYVPVDEKTSVIENCHVLSGTVKASNNMGGLIGHMDSQKTQPTADITIIGCSNAADVTTEAREAGGILGLMNSAREGNYYVTMRGTITFKDCENTGAITSLGGGSPSAGGILGRDHNQAAGQRLKLIFDGCKNSGTITVTANGETHAAGIAAGFYSAGAWLIAKDCVNTGNVVVNNPSSKVYAGGLISYGGVVELIDSTSTGTVTGGTVGNRYVGGAQNILFLEGMDDLTDTVNGYTYYLNGGTSPEYAALVDDASGGGNFHLVETAYKKNCEFVGWYDNAALTGEAYMALNTGVKTYYAKWNRVACDITYVSSVGTAPEAASYPVGSSVNLRTPNQEAGYTFVGWYTDETFSGDAITTINSLGDDMKFYAKWTPVQYTITYVSSIGTVPESATYTVESSVTLPILSQDGYEFNGWYSDNTFSGDAVTSTEGMTGDKTFYAKWDINQYTITFDTDGGSTIEPITKDYDTAVTAPAAPTKTGYTFAGWDKEVPTTMPAEDTTITAKWTINQYTITFAETGDATIDAITQDYSTAVTKPEDPTKTGYTFAGWDKEVPTTMPAVDVTITAQWKINTSTITFDTVGGSTINPISGEYGAAVTKPENPTKEGHTFTGWDKEVPETMPAEDITIKAQWTINEYTITFDTDGGSEFAPIKQDYNTAVTAPAAPTKTGYTFAGWDKEVPTTMPAVDVTITAQWTINQYTITFINDDDTELQSGEVAYGTTPVYNGNTPTKEADAQYTYEFAGWSPEVVAVTGGATYKATYTANPIPDDDDYSEPDEEPQIKPDTPEDEPETPKDTTITIIGTPVETEESLQETIVPEIEEIIPAVPEDDAIHIFESSPIVAAVILDNGEIEEATVTIESTTVWPTPEKDPYEFELEVEGFNGDIAHIVLKVDAASLTELGVTPNDLGVFHYQNGKWVLLESTYTIKDDCVYYVAETPSFSPFKVDFIENGSKPIDNEDIPNQPSEPEKPVKTPAPILGILAGLGAAALIRKK